MIHDPNFALALDDGWQPLPPDAPGLYRFADIASGAALRLWSEAHDSRPVDLDRTARLFVDRQIGREAGTATIYEPIVMPQPWGRAIAYHGHDAGTRFGFSGVVTCRAQIGLRIEADTLSESGLLTMLDDIASKIAFDRIPLEATASTSTL